MKRSTTLAALLATVVALLTVVLPAPATAATLPCSKGLVSLTFDDGPRPAFTPRLLDELARHKVKATFFVVGFRAQRSPHLVRRIVREGHTIGNHTWDHPRLDTLPNKKIRKQLLRTRGAMRAAGVRPSQLMRPPYGRINPRVRKVIRSVGLVPVMWDGDTRDWENGSARDIARRALNQLRPHKRNIVLQHDGVKRSAISVRAVPRIIRGARARGYCFTPLDARGHQVMPVPRLSAQVRGGREGTTHIRVQLKLSTPTPRVTSVRLTTGNETATAGADYVPVDAVVRFAPGVTQRTVQIRVVDDEAHEPVETLRIQLGSLRGLTARQTRLHAAIISDDAPPAAPRDSAAPVSAVSQLLSLRATD